MSHVKQEVFLVKQRGILMLDPLSQTVLLDRNSKQIIVSNKPAKNYRLVPVNLTGCQTPIQIINLTVLSQLPCFYQPVLIAYISPSKSPHQSIQTHSSETKGCQQLFAVNLLFLIGQYNKQLEGMSSIGSMIQLSQRQGSDLQISNLQRGSGYIPGERSGKWSEEEHMKYIVFIDYNKEKMRSKEKRRSNKFYQEMARFISTRNALQCRSHHQKLQEKYTHVNKIINVFKNIFNRTVYKHSLEQLDLINQEKPTEYTIRSAVTDIHTTEVAVQTDIAGINLEFITINPHLIVVQSQDPQFNYHQQPIYPQIYGHMPMEVSMHTLPSPSYYSGGMGWWAGCYPGRSGIN